MSGKPDFLLKAADKNMNGKFMKVGAAWSNDDGSISIVIDRFVVLSGEDKGLVLSLYTTEKPGVPSAD